MPMKEGENLLKERRAPSRRGHADGRALRWALSTMVPLSEDGAHRLDVGEILQWQWDQ